MLRFRRISLILAAFVGVAIFATAPQARADFEVQFSADGQTVTESVQNDSTISVTVGNFTLTGVTTLISAGNGLATIAIDNADIKNTGSSNDTLTIKESATAVSSGTGLTSEPGAGKLFSNQTGQVFAGTLVSADFTSYLNTSNVLFDLTGAVVTPTLTFQNVGPLNNFGSAANPVSTTFSVNSSYSLTNVGDYTLSGGGELVGTLGISQAVAPAPGGLALLATGLPLLGLGWLRRRKQCSPGKEAAQVGRLS